VLHSIPNPLEGYAERRIFDHDFEVRIIERCTRRHLGLHQALTLAAGGHFEGAVMAIGIVARLAEKNVARPSAAREAFLGVVTGATEPPQV
jgi:hypothetical protein